MRLRYNDMSLIADGLFDINGRWGATGGHATHTCGVDADVGLTDAARRFSINENDLNNIIINDSPICISGCLIYTAILDTILQTRYK